MQWVSLLTLFFPTRIITIRFVRLPGDVYQGFPRFAFISPASYRQQALEGQASWKLGGIMQHLLVKCFAVGHYIKLL